MRDPLRIATILAVIFGALLMGCSSESGPGEHRDSGRLEAGRGEHDRDGGEHSREGEESGVELAKTQSYDRIRHGARLVLAYDAEESAFVGTVQNTTAVTLKRVRVEVHLSSGKELGPTKPMDLAPGQKVSVRLSAGGTNFERWTAHPEVGRNEHGHGEHGEGHDELGGGEHH